LSECRRRLPLDVDLSPSEGDAVEDAALLLMVDWWLGRSGGMTANVNAQRHASPQPNQPNPISKLRGKSLGGGHAAPFTSSTSTSG
jgi:hypothetical protein